MARTPFKLRSGNAAAFKNLGSSPAKQGTRFAKKARGRKQINREESLPTEQYKPTDSEVYADQIANAQATEVGRPPNDDDLTTEQANYPGPEGGKEEEKSTDTDASTVEKPKANATQTIIKKKDKRVVVPKIAPVIPPTKEQSEKSKGTLKATSNKKEKDGALDKFYDVLSGKSFRDGVRGLLKK